LPAMDDKHDSDVFKPETFWEKLVNKIAFVVGFVGVFALLWFLVRQR
jgi:hypothetical protein